MQATYAQHHGIGHSIDNHLSGYGVSQFGGEQHALRQSAHLQSQQPDLEQRVLRERDKGTTDYEVSFERWAAEIVIFYAAVALVIGVFFYGASLMIEKYPPFEN